MSIAVKVYQPQFEVILTKTVKRSTVDGATPTSSRFQGVGDQINLRRWLGDGSSINTTKSVSELAGGFSITIPDMPADSDGLDTLYGLVEAMDLIEIRARHGNVLGTGQLPTVMRGFVSRVERNEAMSPSGQPARSVTIQGQDYGKIWQIIQIFYGPSYIFGEDILSAFKLMDKFGAGVKNALSNKEFLNIAISQIVNPFLKKLIPQGSEFPEITVQSDRVVEASVGITGIQTAEGNIGQLLRNYLDIGPFNELFLTEDSNGVYCHYRQNPFLGLDGMPLDPKITQQPSTYGNGATELCIFNVPDRDIQSINVSRSDDNVSNYYWVAAPAFSLNSDTIQRQLGYSSEERSTVDQSSYPNSDAKLYGTRLLWLNTQLGGPSITNVKSGLAEKEQDKRDGDLFDWMRARREFLVAQNKDNSILERGTIRIRGREDIRAGNYVRIVRGTFEAIYYVVSVSHQMLPYRGFFTTLQVDRGLGFANRIKMAGGVDSPYLAELVQR